MSGQIVDATLVAVPRQRNTDEENAKIKAGRVPAAWQARHAKLRHIPCMRVTQSIGFIVILPW